MSIFLNQLFLLCSVFGHISLQFCQPDWFCNLNVASAHSAWLYSVKPPTWWLRSWINGGKKSSRTMSFKSHFNQSFVLNVDMGPPADLCSLALLCWRFNNFIISQQLCLQTSTTEHLNLLICFYCSLALGGVSSVMLRKAASEDISPWGWIWQSLFRIKPKGRNIKAICGHFHLSVFISRYCHSVGD